MSSNGQSSGVAESSSDKIIPSRVQNSGAESSSDKIIPSRVQSSGAESSSDKIIPSRVQSSGAESSSDKIIPSRVQSSEAESSSDKIIPSRVQSSGAESSSDKIIPSHRARVLIQQCLNAQLQVQPATEDKPAEYVQIGRGAIVYICFLQGATSETVKTVVKGVLNVRLCETEEGRYVSVLSLPGDVLIVPHATLGGRAKGPMMQYHQNIDKPTGEKLYLELVQLISDKVKSNSASLQKESVVRNGTYGNRQVLNMQTNGPFGHVLDF